jgi:hypothetical protein
MKKCDYCMKLFDIEKTPGIQYLSNIWFCCLRHQEKEKHRQGVTISGPFIGPIMGPHIVGPIMVPRIVVGPMIGHRIVVGHHMLGGNGFMGPPDIIGAFFP